MPSFPYHEAPPAPQRLSLVSPQTRSLPHSHFVGRRRAVMIALAWAIPAGSFLSKVGRHVEACRAPLCHPVRRAYTSACSCRPRVLRCSPSGHRTNQARAWSQEAQLVGWCPRRRVAAELQWPYVRALQVPTSVSKAVRSSGDRSRECCTAVGGCEQDSHDG